MRSSFPCPRGTLRHGLACPVASRGRARGRGHKAAIFLPLVYALENLVGTAGLAVTPPLVYMLFFLPSLLDRETSVRPQERRLILAVGFGLILLLFGLASDAKLTPAQHHLGM